MKGKEYICKTLVAVSVATQQRKIEKNNCISGVHEPTQKCNQIHIFAQCRP